MRRVFNKSRKMIFTILILVLGLLFILPVFWIFMNSLKPSAEIAADFLALPKSIYLNNFKHAIESMKFFTALRNSIIITCGAVLLAVFFSFCGAFGIAHLRGKVSNGLYMFFVFGQIVPFHAVMIPISILATNTHLTNSLLGLIILDTGFFCPFGILTYSGFLKSVPRELEEAGAIDGCSIPRTMFQIVFPLVKPATITLAVLFFMWSWNDFLLPSILVGESNLRPLTVNLFMFRSATSTEWNLFIAGLTLCIIPTIVLYIAAQKYITSGLTLGAVK